MAGSFPDFPQRLMVKGETRKIEATSLIVRRSGKFSSDILFWFDIFYIISSLISLSNQFILLLMKMEEEDWLKNLPSVESKDQSSNFSLKEKTSLKERLFHIFPNHTNL